MITQSELLDLFDYRDGELFWKKKTCRKVVIGKPLGALEPTGYKNCRIYNKNYRVHRLIFLYHHGYFPINVDHIDTDKTNNRIENLREATKFENMRNITGIKTATGCKNVTWSDQRKKWVVRIKINGKDKNLGGFNDLEFADFVAHEARNKYYGEFANHA